MRDEVSEHYVTKQRQITNSGRLMEEYMSKEEKIKFTEDLIAAQAKQKQ